MVLCKECGNDPRPESAGHPEWLQSTSTERKTYQHNRSTYSQNQNTPDTRYMARDNPEENTSMTYIKTLECQYEI